MSRLSPQREAEIRGVLQNLRSHSVSWWEGVARDLLAELDVLRTPLTGADCERLAQVERRRRGCPPSTTTTGSIGKDFDYLLALIRRLLIEIDLLSHDRALDGETAARLERARIIGWLRERAEDRGAAEWSLLNRIATTLEARDPDQPPLRAPADLRREVVELRAWMRRALSDEPSSEEDFARFAQEGRRLLGEEGQKTPAGDP